MVLNVAASKGQEGKNKYFGLAIGLVIVAGGYAAGAVSGGVLNPAVAIAVDVSSMHLGFGWCFSYVQYEFAGAALAAGLFRLVRPEEPALCDLLRWNERGFRCGLDCSCGDSMQ